MLDHQNRFDASVSAMPELTSALQGRDLAYLLTVSSDLRVHSVVANVRVAGPYLDIVDVGRRSAAHMVERPYVTLLWPPLAPGGYAVVVDGTTTLSRQTARVVPSRAIFHRAATNRPDGGRGADCLPIPLSRDHPRSC